MRSRLFWKILLGFWITFLCILQGVWMAYAILWGDRASYEWSMAQEIAPYQISAAKLAIERGGPAKLEEVSREWGDPRWSQLSVSEATALPASSAGAEAETVRARAVAPDGKAWEITLAMPSEKWGDSWEERRESWLHLPFEWAVPAALGGLLFSALLAWYLARPIRLLRQGFQSLAGGRLETRLRPRMGSRRDEIADMATDFDGMAERLQQLVGARDRLLHDVSHELRSPLARVSLAVALAEKDPRAPKEPLHRIAVEVARLDKLVGELLSLSRRESRASELDAWLDMPSLVDAVVADARFEARAKNVEIAMRNGAGERMLVQGNAELIRRAIENVLRNAVKFSPDGGCIDVALSLDEPAQRMQLSVSDRGPGVPEPDLERMVEPFVRLEDNGRRQGYGLGLAIARRAIESHHGRLGIANRPEGGLVATLTLPLPAVAPDLVERVFEEDA